MFEAPSKQPGRVAKRSLVAEVLRDPVRYQNKIEEKPRGFRRLAKVAMDLQLARKVVKGSP